MTGMYRTKKPQCASYWKNHGHHVSDWLLNVHALDPCLRRDDEEPEKKKREKYIRVSGLIQLIHCNEKVEFINLPKTSTYAGFQICYVLASGSIIIYHHCKVC
jgi:hypothetical protein